MSLLFSQTIPDSGGLSEELDLLIDFGVPFLEWSRPFQELTGRVMGPHRGPGVDVVQNSSIRERIALGAGIRPVGPEYPGFWSTESTRDCTISSLCAVGLVIPEKGLQNFCTTGCHDPLFGIGAHRVAPILLGSRSIVDRGPFSWHSPTLFLQIGPEHVNDVGIHTQVLQPLANFHEDTKIGGLTQGNHECAIGDTCRVRNEDFTKTSVFSNVQGDGKVGDISNKVFRGVFKDSHVSSHGSNDSFFTIQVQVDTDIDGQVEEEVEGVEEAG